MSKRNWLISCVVQLSLLFNHSKFYLELRTLVVMLLTFSWFNFFLLIESWLFISCMAIPILLAASKSASIADTLKVCATPPHTGEYC